VIADGLSAVHYVPDGLSAVQYVHSNPTTGDRPLFVFVVIRMSYFLSIRKENVEVTKQV